MLIERMGTMSPLEMESEQQIDVAYLTLMFRINSRAVIETPSSVSLTWERAIWENMRGMVTEWRQNEHDVIDLPRDGDGGYLV